MATTIATAELSKNVTAFLNKPKRMLVGGEWLDSVSGKTFETYNPATGETLVRVAEGDRADIDRAVKAARKAFESGPWPNLSPSDRGRLIWKLGDLLEQHLDEFAELESLDNGKPVSVALVADVPLAVDLFRYMAGWATKIEGNTIPISVSGARYFAYTLREPVGVVDYSLEFPAVDGGVEARPGFGRRLYRGDETRRTDSTDRVAPRRADRGGGIPSGSCEYRARIGGNSGRCASCPPRCRQNRVHWLD